MTTQTSTDTTLTPTGPLVSEPVYLRAPRVSVGDHLVGLFHGAVTAVEPDLINPRRILITLASGHANTYSAHDVLSVRRSQAGCTDSLTC